MKSHRSKELRKGLPVGKKGKSAGLLRPGQKADGTFTQNTNIGQEYRFKPGQSGNPAGRPKKSILDESLERLLSKTSQSGRSKADKLVKKIFQLALKQGNAKLLQLIFERVGGKPLQSLDVSGKIDDSRSMDPEQRKARITELSKKLKRVGLV